MDWAQFVRSRLDSYSIAGTNLPAIVTRIPDDLVVDRLRWIPVPPPQGAHCPADQDCDCDEPGDDKLFCMAS